MAAPSAPPAGPRRLNALGIPEDATPEEARAQLERIAEERHLPVFTTHAQWQRQFADLGLENEPLADEMLELVMAERQRRRAPRS